MDRKSWPWKKKSSEKAATVTEVVDQENGKKPSYIQISMDQYSNLSGLKDEVKNYEERVVKLEDQIKDLDLKLSTANADITAKEVLVKQHSKVAEEAVTVEVEDLDLLLEHVDNTNFRRTCNYLTSAAKYLPGPDDMLVLDIAYTIYIRFAEYPNALQIALFLDNMQVWLLIFT